MIILVKYRIIFFNTIKIIVFILYIIIFFLFITLKYRTIKVPSYKRNDIKVIKISKNITLFSAFYYQNEKKIVIIGFSKLQNPSNVSCLTIIQNSHYKNCSKFDSRVYNKINKHFYVINIYYINDFHKLIINNYYINPLVIKYDNPIFNCTLCITKFINYTAYTYLIEAITSYIEIGIDHIVIYYTSSSDKVYKILLMYKQKKIVDIIRWNKDYEINFMKKYVYGQLWKYNDCLYRYKSKSKYMIFNDIDEVLWNNNTITLPEIITYYDLEKYDVLYLYNRIFRKEFLSNNNYTNSRIIPYDRYNHYIPNFSMFKYHNSCTYRKNYLKKYILVNYSNIEFLGIHEILVFKKKLKFKFINSNILFLRHTRRVREDLINDCKKWEIYYSSKELHIMNKTSKID